MQEPERRGIGGCDPGSTRLHIFYYKEVSCLFYPTRRSPFRRLTVKGKPPCPCETWLSLHDLTVLQRDNVNRQHLSGLTVTPDVKSQGRRSDSAWKEYAVAALCLPASRPCTPRPNSCCIPAQDLITARLSVSLPQPGSLRSCRYPCPSLDHRVAAPAVFPIQRSVELRRPVHCLWAGSPSRAPGGFEELRRPCTVSGHGRPRWCPCRSRRPAGRLRQHMRPSSAPRPQGRAAALPRGAGCCASLRTQGPPWTAVQHRPGNLHL